jgi:HAD superfamily hydrolase (TIGR01459 family)
MTDLIASLDSIAARYDAVFCDLWGCLHNGERPFPAAVAALQRFRATGGSVVLLTNAPRPSPQVIRQLDRIGVPRDAWDLVVSSGDASREALVSGAVGRRVWHCGPEKDGTFFTDSSDGLDASDIVRVPLEEAEGIVCTGLFDDRTETPEDYRARLHQAKAKGLRLLCSNPDIVVDLGERRVFCAGAIAALYEDMGGTALYFGKPHPPIYDLARRRLSGLRRIGDDHILAIGDGFGTDIRGGMAEGLDTLYITGGISAAEFGEDPTRPDRGRILAFLEGQKLAATFAIPFLA